MRYAIVAAVMFALLAAGWVGATDRESGIEKLGRLQGEDIYQHWARFKKPGFEPGMTCQDLQNKSLALLGNQAAGRLVSPFGIAFDSHDKVYVYDVQTKQVQIYDSEWNIKASVHTISGQELVNPTGLALDEARRRLFISTPVPGTTKREPQFENTLWMIATA